MRFRSPPVVGALVVAAVAMTLLAARTASASTWRGDFETGDLTQWSGVEMVAGDPIRLKVVDGAAMGSYGVRQGKYALRVTVHQGDDPIGASGNRAELVHAEGATWGEGDEIYLGWSTLFPTDFGVTDTWQVFTQFHHTGCCGSPPLELDVTKETLQLVSQKEGVFDETVLWSTPLERGKWHDFVWHIKWSTDATKGLVELWYDGAHVLPKRSVRTLFSDGHAYLKQGYYRNSTIAWPGVLYHDGTSVGATYDDVAPVRPAADAGPLDGSTSDAVSDGARPSTDAAMDAWTDADAARDPAAEVGDASGDAVPNADSATGCGCRLTGRAPSATPSLGAALIVAGVLARRRSRGVVFAQRR